MWHREVRLNSSTLNDVPQQQACPYTESHVREVSLERIQLEAPLLRPPSNAGGLRATRRLLTCRESFEGGMARLHVKSTGERYWITLSGTLRATDLGRLENACGTAPERHEGR